MKLFLVLVLCAASAFAAPLDATEAELVRSTWNQVKHNEVDILYAIFKDHPDIQARFPAFVGKDLDSLKGTGPFALHATRIVSLISEVVGLLGNPSNEAAINSIVTNMANNHKARGIPKSQFNEFRASLFTYLKAHVSWGDNVEAAWVKGADNLFNGIFAVIES